MTTSTTTDYRVQLFKAEQDLHKVWRVLSSMARELAPHDEFRAKIQDGTVTALDRVRQEAFGRLAEDVYRACASVRMAADLLEMQADQEAAHAATYADAGPLAW